jgi:hypothetical protein
MLIWPYQLLSPRTENWNLSGVAINGGVSAAGTSSSTRTDGGGLWVGTQNFLLSTRAQIKTLRAIAAALDGSVIPIVCFSHERPYAPTGSEAYVAPFGDGAPFSDSSEWSGEAPVIATSEAAALRATTLSFATLAGELEGGERFSISHPIMGPRRYVISSVDAAAGTMAIRPPLREAVGAGVVLNFIDVGCVCKLANPEEWIGDMQTDGTVEVNARWVEGFA